MPDVDSPTLVAHPLTKRKSDALSMDGDRPAVKAKPRMERNRVLVTGGAGFVGSHLCEYLVKRGDHVICVDNLFTGSKDNIAHLLKEPNFELIRHDVVEPILLEIDQVYHLACPASPVHYKYNPIKTMKTGFIGTMNMLGLAKRCKARFLLTSTSEVYVVNVVFASAKIQRTPLVSPRSSHPNHLTDHLTDHPTDHPTDHLTHLTHGRPFQLRRPSRAPANRELFRERQLQRRTQLLRRGQARGRVSDDGLSPRTRPGGEDRPYF
mmetsp:Transcript_11581/g.32523  ORF Transcript_11581/g.32523 Transcript_11581/m.32523 type:complete len:265 (-) Transcript_11581:2802-3596(-)